MPEAMISSWNLCEKRGVRAMESMASRDLSLWSQSAEGYGQIAWGDRPRDRLTKYPCRRRLSIS
jgi:hypothetical protein